MAMQRIMAVGWRGAIVLAVVLGLLMGGCGLASPSLRSVSQAAPGGAEPTATPGVTPTAAATRTPKAPPVVAPSAVPLAAPMGAPMRIISPIATPWLTPTATPTIAMLVGPAVPWLTAQASCATPRPVYVAATPPQGPAVATAPPRPFPGSPAPTWTPAPSAFPVLPGQPTPGTPSAPSGPRLELVSVTDLVDAGTGELVVTGEVRNISDGVLSGVRAVVNLFDAQGRLLGSASEVLVFPNLEPDQRSPFVVAQADRDGRSRYTVQFLDAEGRVIETVDATG